MRTLQWLFLVSAALFVCGIGFIVVGERNARAATPAVEAPLTTPVANLKQIMNAIVGPGATVIYEAVSTKISAAGVEEVEPRNDAEWAVIGNSAAAVAEAGNLMLMGDREIDKGDWVTMTRAFMDAARKALDAANKKDKDGIVDAGGDLNTTCDNCHAKYKRQ